MSPTTNSMFGKTPKICKQTLYKTSFYVKIYVYPFPITKLKYPRISHNLPETEECVTGFLYSILKQVAFTGEHFGTTINKHMITIIIRYALSCEIMTFTLKFAVKQ